ncbi:hypothetical protein ACOBQB_10455 [Streptomyces sp. G5(2025)]|uniref:hypothetical protein n=1 Tax=Streptomyces sp. G5(2025) TaxID=3406628 RepID=UPI003C291766
MTDVAVEPGETDEPGEKPDWDERWLKLLERIDPHAAVVLAALGGLGLLATLGVTGTQLHDWLEREQGLRGTAVPVTALLLGGIVIWSAFLPFRTDRHLVVDVPTLTAYGIVFYGVHWGMIPAVHPQTVSWWAWHTALVTLLCALVPALPAAVAALIDRGPDPAPAVQQTEGTPSGAGGRQ